MPEEKLVIFAKAPRLGQVKSRLAADIGPEAALVAYHNILLRLFNSLATVDSVEICHTPANAGPELAHFAVNKVWRTAQQVEGDLGQKLAAAFGDAFAQGYSRVVIIGSDCPYVTIHDISDAFKSLQEKPLVLGPATDGGYWLIGLNRMVEELFEKMPWSSDLLLEKTVEKARDLDMPFQLLRELRDIDEMPDWQHYLARSKFLIDS
jgi:rSAM/selenodomain-associated transferase 1